MTATSASLMIYDQYLVALISPSQTSPPQAQLCTRNASNTWPALYLKHSPRPLLLCQR